MCTFSQLKKTNTNYVQPPPLPQGVNGPQNLSKLWSSGVIDFSKCIEDGSIKLTRLVDYINMYAITNTYPCN